MILPSLEDFTQAVATESAEIGYSEIHRGQQHVANREHRCRPIHRTEPGRRRSGSDGRSGPGGEAVAAPAPASRRAGSRRTACGTRASSGPVADHAALGPAESRVEEQLARVVAGLAVDVDCPGEVGGRRSSSQKDRRTRRRARRGRPARPLVDGRGRSRPLVAARTRRDAGHRRQDVSRLARIVGLADIDVGQLMVADGEGPAAERVQDLAERAGADSEAGLAQASRFR